MREGRRGNARPCRELGAAGWEPGAPRRAHPLCDGGTMGCISPSPPRDGIYCFTIQCASQGFGFLFIFPFLFSSN